MDIPKMEYDLEYVDCGLCDSDSTELLFTKDSFKIVRCAGCGFVYVNPRLTQDKINALYDSQYFHGKGFDKTVNYYQEFVEKPVNEVAQWKLRLEEIKKYRVNCMHAIH